MNSHWETPAVVSDALFMIIKSKSYFVICLSDVIFRVAFEYIDNVTRITIVVSRLNGRACCGNCNSFHVTNMSQT